MFKFLRKPKTADVPADSPAFPVAQALERMGYDLTPYGVAVSLLELDSGYTAAETASHIALTTLALDARERLDDAHRLMEIVPHGAALLEVIKYYKDQGQMNPSQWQNDSTAIFRVINLDQYQEEWISKILSDPVAGKARLATSRIRY